MSFWNGFLPDFSEIFRVFRADTSVAHAFLPAALAGTRQRLRPIRGGFLILAAAADLLALAGAAGAAAAIHRLATPNLGGTLDIRLETWAILGFFLVAVSMLRNDYGVAHYLSPRGLLERLYGPWCLAVAMALIVLLPARAASHPLFPILIIFATGLATVSLARIGLAQALRERAAEGQVVARRIFLLGYEPELEAFVKSWEPHRFGLHVVAASVLGSSTNLEDDLALARAYARILAPDDVFLLIPWDDKKTIEASLNAFLGIPAALHLGPEKFLERFSEARVATMGPIRCLNLVDHPLSPPARFMKRLIDIVLASFALILLSPLLLIVAITIKLDSPGPIIFRQHRYGFNQKPFRIFKFRSMTTCEDNSKLVQVTTRTDARLTKVGAFLRRHNVDELPQLFNVIRGEMSLVGPRPMAVAHDQMFERCISLYSRRHNVKPGITGWAQINGWRGGISEEKIRARVEHDLYYIDNWSLWFDLKIMWRTLFSKEAYIDAF